MGNNCSQNNDTNDLKRSFFENYVYKFKIDDNI